MQMAVLQVSSRHKVWGGQGQRSKSPGIWCHCAILLVRRPGTGWRGCHQQKGPPRMVDVVVRGGTQRLGARVTRHEDTPLPRDARRKDGSDNTSGREGDQWDVMNRRFAAMKDGCLPRHFALWKQVSR